MASTSAAKGIIRKTGYLFHELFFWHNPGQLQSLKQFIQPTRHWESAETKRRMHNLLSLSGLLDQLHHLKPRHATTEELCRVHRPEYVKKVQLMNEDLSKGSHEAGDHATFAPGGYDIATLSAGGAISAVDAVMKGEVKNAYALIRPPGHHAEAGEGAGFCIFNNVAVAAAHAMSAHGLSRVAIVDYDAHHGNGTQHIFEHNDKVLFISIHQAGNYPLHSGSHEEVGQGPAEGLNINVPLPPGSGSGAYQAAFNRVVLPALDAFKPELLLVSSGFDPSYMDNLAAMILSSEDFRWMAQRLMESAERNCDGKLVMVHEGGYSELYVPFCGLAVVEALSGIRTQVQDPYLHEVQNWGYQDLQVHQDEAIRKAEEALALLKQRMGAH